MVTGIYTSCGLQRVVGIYTSCGLQRRVFFLNICLDIIVITIISWPIRSHFGPSLPFVFFVPPCSSPSQFLPCSLHLLVMVASPPQLTTDDVQPHVMNAASRMWHTGHSDGPGHESGCWLDALHGWSILARHQIYPEPCKATSMRQHQAHPDDDRLSAFSDMLWSKLLRPEWFVSIVEHHFNGQGTDDYELSETPDTTRFHGTTLRAAESMIRTGGFIPGPNGHGYKGKYLQGLFCAKTLGEAFMRVDPWRESINGNLQFGGCPVVVELAIASVQLRRYHKTRRGVKVVLGDPGVIMKGVKVQSIHVNCRCFWNFCIAKCMDVSREVCCGHGSPGCSTCGQYISHEKQARLWKKTYDPKIGYRSGAGYVYCEHCARMYCSQSVYIGIQPELK